MNKKPERARYYLLRHMVIVLLLTAAATSLSFIISYLGFTEVNIVIVYIISVLLAAHFTGGYLFGIVASVMSTLAFNFFFTEPIYTLTVYDKSYIFTFLTMLVAAIFTSTLTSKLIYARERAKQQKKQAHILYQVTSSLAKTGGSRDVILESMSCLSKLFDCTVFCLIQPETGDKSEKLSLFKQETKIVSTEISKTQAKQLTEHCYSKMVEVRDKKVCTFCLPTDLAESSLEVSYLLDSVFVQIIVALEREYLAEEKENAKIEAEQERFKSNLLRAVSHDLRTPLSSIAGAAEMLLHELKLPEEIKVARGIYEDTVWLTRLVENILNLTRIQEKNLKINTCPEAVEEIVAEAIRRVQKLIPSMKIAVTMPEELIFVPMDSKLIIQVLINLLENAAKHSAPEGLIELTLLPAENKVWFTVTDRGPGIAPADLEKIFEIFYTAEHNRADAKRGIGLGLAISKAIVEMHGGEIYACNNELGGATLSFYLKRREE